MTAPHLPSQWHQPPATSQSTLTSITTAPKPQSKLQSSKVLEQSSGMKSSTPPVTFTSSLAQTASNVASPLLSNTSTTVASSALNVTTPTTHSSPPFGFTQSPPCDLSVESSEGSQELKAMNKALIQSAIKEEISQFDHELSQLSQTVHKININVVDATALEKLLRKVQGMADFSEKLRKTTEVQNSEISCLRSFLQDSLSYMESLKGRIRLQRNPEYMSVLSPKTLDPIQAHKMMDIRTNFQFVETKLNYITQELSSKWSEFQESNKENREAMQIPSLEAIYEAMMVHNNVLMNHKKRVDELEIKLKMRSRKKLINKISQMINDEADMNGTEFNKIVEDFLTLNLNSLKSSSTVENLQESISKLFMSSHDPSFLNFKTPQSDMNSEKMMLLKQVFAECEVKHTNCDRLPPIQQTNTMLPNVSSISHSASISSCQPVVQSGSKTSVDNKEALSAFKETSTTDKETPTPVMNVETSILAKESVQSREESKYKSNLITPPPSVTYTSFGTDKKIESTLESTIQFPLQMIQTSSGLSVGEVTNQTVPVNTHLVPVSNLGSTKFNSNHINTQPSTTVSSTTSMISGKSAPVGTSNASATNLPKTFTATYGNRFSFNSSVSSPDPVLSSLSQTELLEPFNSLSATVNMPFKFTPAESTTNLARDLLLVPSSPLTSVNFLVPGIQLQQPNKGISIPSNTLHIQNEARSKTNLNTSPTFKVSSAMETKNPGKEPVLSTQSVKVFGFPIENKLELMEKEQSSRDARDQNSNSADIKCHLDGALKEHINFKSVKSDFENIPPSTSPETPSTEVVKANETPKNLFNLPSTPSANVFSTSNMATLFSQNQKVSSASISVSEESGKLDKILKTSNHQYENSSPILEAGLKTRKVGDDSKTSLEKESLHNKPSVIDQTQSDTDSKVDSLFSSFNSSAGTTLRESSQSIFGSALPVKPSPKLEIVKTETQEINDLDQNKVENKSSEEDKNKQPESYHPHSLFVGTIVTSTPATSFSFSTSTLQEALPPSENIHPQESSRCSIGLELPLTSVATSTTLIITTTQVNSTFSFAESTSQLPNTAFSFALPTTNTPTTGTNSFNFGSFSTGVTEDKSKTAFSFGQQAPISPATTSVSVFGGFGSKPTHTTGVFSQENATTTGKSQSVFDIPSGSAETKTVFGQNIATKESESIFDQTSSSTPNTKPVFSFSLSLSTTTSQSASFCDTPATPTTTFFGQPICSPLSTASSSSGQPITTSVFGSTSTSPFGRNSEFGTKTTFGQSGGSFFSQSGGGFGSSGNSLFGGGSPSIFSSSNSTTANSHHQSQGGNGSGFGGSFSSGGQAVGQTGFSSSTFQNNPATFGSSTPPVFGSTPAFGGAATFGGAPAFGSPPKVFGSPISSSPDFGVIPQQQSSTFENLANQNTMTFGNLAQNPSPQFGSMFSAQSKPSTDLSAAPTGGSMFGGNSFSSWR